LPEDKPEREWVKAIFTPRVIVLAIIAGAFVIRNVYIQATAPVDKSR
jgi:hypothetical protein